jgi:hypothetical protein
MTQADIEVMLQHLADTTRGLGDTSLRLHLVAEQLALVADHLQAMGAHTDAAITAGLTHLHRENKSER